MYPINEVRLAAIVEAHQKEAELRRAANALTERTEKASTEKRARRLAARYRRNAGSSPATHSTKPAPQSS